MRVSSPIGELPFEPRRIRLVGGAVEVEGAMGAWPAHVVIDLSDAPALVRLIAKPLAVVSTLAAVIGIAVALGRRK